MDLALSSSEQAIDELFSAFFARESPPPLARAAEPLGFDPALWKRLTTTGAPGMAVDGATTAELAVLAEQLGRAIAPVPLVEHLVASLAIPEPEVRDGDLMATIALRPSTAGTWRLVPAGAVADVVVGVDGGELVAVANDPPGEAPRNFASAPLADRQVTGDRTVLGPASDFEALHGAWLTLTAATLVGVATSALRMAVDYVKDRHQFGVPIGSFQAVQHGLADLPGPIDGARLLVHRAATAHGTKVDVDDLDIEDPGALASMAFLFAADVAEQATDRALHYHGGYGFAEEHDVQLYYRRARGWALVHGDPDAEALRLAGVLFGGRR